MKKKNSFARVGLSVIASSSVLLLSSATVFAAGPWTQGGNATGAVTSIGTTDNFGLQIITNNTEKVRITTGGRVGIGTNSPDGALDIKGIGNLNQLVVKAGNTQTNANGLVALQKSDGTMLMEINSDDPSNIFIGKDAGASNVANCGGGYAGCGNTFVGLEAGTANTSGQVNVALGAYALKANTTGILNVALGVNSLTANTTGNFNVAVGTNNLYKNTTGVQNTALGDEALTANTTGGYNVAVGQDAAANNITGSRIVALGKAAKVMDVNAQNAVVIGGNSITNNIGSNSLDIGNLIYATGMDGTGVTLSTGSVGIGTIAPSGKLEVAGSSNVPVLVVTAHSTQTPANGMIALKKFDGTLLSEFSADDASNIFVGKDAGNSNAANCSAGYAGCGNAFIGLEAGAANTSGQLNIALGAYALKANTSGILNVGIGANALTANTTGNFNVAVGTNNLYKNTTGVQNTAVGDEALTANTTGGYNVAVGQDAGANNTTGNNNVFLGKAAKSGSATANNSIVIGGNSIIGGGTNTLDIGNLIFGTGLDGTGTNLSGGKIGIGIVNPGAKLQVSDITLDGTVVRIADNDGSCDLNPESGSLVIACSSDVRLKSDIQGYSGGLSELSQYAVKEYTVKKSGDRVVGVIAQEVQNIAPSKVHTGSEGYLVVDQPNPWVIVNAVQQVNQKVDKLQNPERLCVGKTCVTESQLQKLLQLINAQEK